METEQCGSVRRCWVHDRGDWVPGVHIWWPDGTPYVYRLQESRDDDDIPVVVGVDSDAEYEILDALLSARFRVERHEE